MPRRYFLVKAISEDSISSEQFGKALTDSVRRYFGEFGLSRIDPKLIRFDPQRSEAIIACKSNETDDLQAAIALLSNEPDATITALVIRISGTIKALRRRK